MIGDAQGVGLSEWLDISVQKQLAGSATKDLSVSVLVQIVVGVLIWTGVVHVFEHVVEEVKVPTAIGRSGYLEGVEHRLVDVRAEIDAEFEVHFDVEVDTGDAGGLEVDFVVVVVAGDDAEFGLEEVVVKIVLSKFVFGVEDGQLQHTWTDSQ